MTSSRLEGSPVRSPLQAQKKKGKTFRGSLGKKKFWDEKRRKRGLFLSPKGKGGGKDGNCPLLFNLGGRDGALFKWAWKKKKEVHVRHKGGPGLA